MMAEAPGIGPRVHPTATIADGATIGNRVTIGPHAVVYDNARIADHVWIGAGAVIGAPPEVRDLQLLAWPESVDSSRHTRIESGVVVREHCVISQGTERDTVIGANSYLMNAAYVGHDCRLSDGVTLASGVRLAGHVWVGREANVGLNAAVHQRRRIGGGAMIGMGAVVTRDIPPLAKAYGSPARVVGANLFRLRALGVSDPTSELIEDAFKTGGGTHAIDALAAVDALTGYLVEWSESR